ncbi:MAG: O-antigen ligase family protein [Flavobacteriales bacterium]|nr:O-antigen ligase family protein [Flavobacteriales bacterium]
MFGKKELQLVYGTVLLFLAAALVAIAFDIYYVLALPLLPIAIYFLFFKTEQMLYFLAFATPLSIPVKDIGGGIGMSIPTEPLIFFMFCGILFKLVNGSTFDKRLLRHPLTIIILLDIAWMFVSTVGSTMPLVSLKYTLARLWFVLVFYLGLTEFFRKKKAIAIFLWCFSVATVILSLYTLKNHAAESFTRLYSYTAMRPFLPDHGMYAAAISFVIPLMLVLLSNGRRSGLNWFGVGSAAAFACIVIVAVVFSFTRASWLSLVVAGGVWVILKLKIQFRTLMILGAVAVVMLFAFQSVLLEELGRNKQESDDDITEHVQSFSNVTTDPSNLERLNRWSCAYRMFLDKPILGFGPGTYTFQYAPYQVSSELSIISTHSGDLGNVHSEVLRPFAESGVLSGVLYVLMVLVVLHLGFKVYYSTRDTQSRSYALGALLGLITYFAHGMLNNYSDFDKIAVPMWSFMAAIMAIHLHHQGVPERSEEGSPKTPN